MKVFLKYILIFFTTQLIVQCEIRNKGQGDIEIVDLATAVKQQMKSSLQLSLLSEKQIEYIQLETPGEININEEFLRVYADSDIIVLIGFRQIYLFNRRSGGFIREIGQFGKGPNEYSATSHHSAYDYSRKSILVYQWDRNKFIEYNIKGKIIRKLNFSSPTVGEFNGQVNHLESNIYAAYYNNYKSNDGKRLGIIDTK